MPLIHHHRFNAKQVQTTVWKIMFLLGGSCKDHSAKTQTVQVTVCIYVAIKTQEKVIISGFRSII